jgi:UTP--glucose-1-phosphate uridylyltransferase
MNVRKAVILAAGYGTRLLPATKAVPKEMLPLVDRPVIHYIVDEALAAGLDQIIMVTNASKTAIEAYFDRDYELESVLQSAQKRDLLEAGISLDGLRPPERATRQWTRRHDHARPRRE